MRPVLFLRTLVCVLSMACASAFALVPDNGFGTANMPLLENYTSETPMHIVDGLPAASTIDMAGAVMTIPSGVAEQAGGTMGGTQSAAEGLGWQWSMQGTGAMSGYSRNIFLPLGGPVASFPTPGLVNTGIEVHAAPRTNNAPVQSYNTDMFRMFGQITGDPDFDLLRFVGGTDFGLPSPGHTTLFQSGPNWAVDSFFDITYRIDFVGAPGGPLAGMSGSTTHTVRISVPEPTSLVMLLPMGLMLSRRIRRH